MPGADGGIGQRNGGNPTAVDLSDFEAADKELAERRMAAREDFIEAAELGAQAERDYRRKVAVAYAEAKAEGLSDKRAEVEARSVAADLAFDRDLQAALAQAARMRVAECERSQASLRHVSERSGREAG
jgi:hypothetical protein